MKLVKAGVSAEVADAVAADPTLVTARDVQGISALQWSVYAGQPIIRDYLLNQLMEQGAELDVFEAASVGDVARLEEILAADPDAVRSVSADGWTALHLAAAFSSPEAVELLLEHGAAADAVSRNPQSNQPLHAALALGRNAETVHLLLGNGAKADAVQVGGFTGLFSAAAANRRDLVDMLLAHGANPLHRNDQGKTAADYARERGHEDMGAWLESRTI